MKIYLKIVGAEPFVFYYLLKYGSVTAIDVYFIPVFSRMGCKKQRTRYKYVNGAKKSMCIKFSYVYCDRAYMHEQMWMQN